MHQRLFDDRMDLKENHRKNCLNILAPVCLVCKKAMAGLKMARTYPAPFFPLHIDTILPIRYKTISSHKID